MGMKKAAGMEFRTPMGKMALAWVNSEKGIKIVRILLPRKDPFRDMRELIPGLTEGTDRGAAALARRISRYISGDKIALPIDLIDLEALNYFQRKVLLAEYEIPRGKTTSYSKLAAGSGFPGAARAAGTALARNPFPIVIPCHRSIRSDGSLGGFGGGLPMKRALLEMEGVGFDSRGRVRPEFMI
ncbi:MAG: methylated-DNA--[protein]-cysteine S-methyltransferase [Syntrophales bacterium]|nr:methylated-DNA--[protein]-cysteine S-methyltransferase [Syntrophales bacterium]MDD5533289.1 methylated-DNA--[protein]-cysteine S-methyltransferase [Syntrophales bacterium]